MFLDPPLLDIACTKVEFSFVIRHSVCVDQYTLEMQCKFVGTVTFIRLGNEICMILMRTIVLLPASSSSSSAFLQL